MCVLPSKQSVPGLRVDGHKSLSSCGCCRDVVVVVDSVRWLKKEIRKRPTHPSSTQDDRLGFHRPTIESTLFQLHVFRAAITTPSTKARTSPSTSGSSSSSSSSSCLVGGRRPGRSMRAQMQHQLFQSKKKMFSLLLAEREKMGDWFYMCVYRENDLLTDFREREIYLRLHR